LLIINNSCWPCPRWWRRADWPYATLLRTQRSELVLARQDGLKFRDEDTWKCMLY